MISLSKVSTKTCEVGACGVRDGIARFARFMLSKEDWEDIGIMMGWKND